MRQSRPKQEYGSPLRPLEAKKATEMDVIFLNPAHKRLSPLNKPKTLRLIGDVRLLLKISEPEFGIL